MDKKQKDDNFSTLYIIENDFVMEVIEALNKDQEQYDEVNMYFRKYKWEVTS